MKEFDEWLNVNKEFRERLIDWMELTDKTISLVLVRIEQLQERIESLETIRTPIEETK